MATDLTADFDAGRLAFLEGAERNDTNCPYYATSDSADAWHAGFEYEKRRPSVYGASRVWKGRGYTVNVVDGTGHPNPRNAPRFVYAIAWDASASPRVTMTGAGA